MDKVLNKTMDVLTRFGERIERRLSTDGINDVYLSQSSNSLLPSAQSAFHRPLDGRADRSYGYVSRRQYSSDHLVASPGQSSFNNYRQHSSYSSAHDGTTRPPYGTGIGAPLNNFYNSAYQSSGSNIYNSGAAMPYGSLPGSVGYAPDYYIAERRQVELVPAPPPRIVQQPVPYAVPVDRPVPQPYPVAVPAPVPVDRPVPVPVPSPYPVDRPVAVPVPVPVPSPPPPPVCVPVPVPVPSPVPCYVPVAVPVPSPPPSPVMFQQSVTYNQSWSTGTPLVVPQPQYPVGVMSSYGYYGGVSYVR